MLKRRAPLWCEGRGNGHRGVEADGSEEGEKKGNLRYQLRRRGVRRSGSGSLPIERAEKGAGGGTKREKGRVKAVPPPHG